MPDSISRPGQGPRSPPQTSKPLSALRSKPSRGGVSLSYRYLARQIDVDLPVDEEGGRTILFSSPASFALSNEAFLMLAHFLASELGRRVLVVDGTFGERGAGSAFGHAGALGLLDLVYGVALPFNELVQPTSSDNVFVLPTGRTDVARMLPMETRDIAAFFKQARAGYDYVLLQQGPIYAEPRYLQFTRQADMVLMLVEEGGTPLEQLNRCMTVFRDHQINKVRIVLSVPR